MTIQFMSYPAVNSDSADKTLYGDIITHCKDWRHFAEASSKYTTAHEVTHGVNNDLRAASGDWEKKNGFYVGQSRAVILDEPNFKKSQIVEFIPTELRSARYNLYVVGQKAWDDKPLYIYDEGVAYINGAWAAIELKETENYVEAFPAEYSHFRNVSIPVKTADYPFPIRKRDQAGNTIVDGHVEFIPYCTAVLIKASISVAGHANIPDNLKDFSRWLFRHACNAYYRCLKNFPPFSVQDQLWSTMKTGECFSSQRAFLKNVIGFEFPDREVPEDDDTNPPWFA